MGTNLTPLNDAIVRGNFDEVKRLLREGKNVNSCDNRGWNTLHFAAQAGNAKIVKLLLRSKKLDKERRSYAGETPLFIAVTNNAIACVEELIRAGCDINAAVHSVTPLHEACRKGYLEIVQLLVNRGADLDAADFDEDTPLHMSATSANVEITRVLLYAGAQPELQDSNGVTALMAAINHLEDDPFRCITQTVDELLLFCTDVNMCTVDGWSALHFALNNGYMQLARSLLSLGASVNSIAEGLLPLHLALTSQDPELFQDILLRTDKSLLTRTGVKNIFDFLLSYTCFGNNMNSLRKALIKLFELDNVGGLMKDILLEEYCDLEDITRVNRAISEDDKAIIYLFLSHGCRFTNAAVSNLLDKEFAFNDSVVGILIDHGVDFNTKLFEFVAGQKKLEMHPSWVLVFLQNSLQVDVEFVLKKCSTVPDKTYHQLKELMEVLAKICTYQDRFAIVKRDLFEVPVVPFPTLLAIARDKIRETLKSQCRTSEQFRNVLRVLQVPGVIKDIIRYRNI